LYLKLSFFHPLPPPKGEIFAARKDAYIYISPFGGGEGGGKCAITAKCYNQKFSDSKLNEYK